MNFIQENIGQILGYLFGAGGLSAFLFERRKNTAVTKGVEADADAKEINNGTKVIDLYKEALDDLQNRYEKRYNEISEMFEKKYQLMRDEMQQLEASFERKNKLLEDEIKLKNKFISSLKRELRERDAEIKRLKAQAAK